jgi:hypothetical protein
MGAPHCSCLCVRECVLLCACLCMHVFHLFSSLMWRIVFIPHCMARRVEKGVLMLRIGKVPEARPDIRDVFVY